MYKIFLLLYVFFSTSVFAQPKLYTTANAHSHNDYEKPIPFYEAYKHQFGSIEADIFLVDGSEELYVAHHRSDLDKKRRTLDSLYLLPLRTCIRKNNGSVYADTTRKLQLLIDIKTEAVPTLARLIKLLQNYPELISTSNLTIVISGNRPPVDSFSTYPSFIYFDGIVGTVYAKQALSRIPLYSANFSQYSKWNGIGDMPENERTQLVSAIAQVHHDGKPVRFWGAPDTADAWKELIRLRADYINTDRISELSEFLKGLK